MRQGLEQVKRTLRYRYLLGQLISRNVKRKYRRSVLGVLWTVLHPLLNMTVMVLVFSGFYGREQGFEIYVMTGMLIVHFNSEATTASMMSIVNNRGLLNKIYVPKMLFPFSSVLSALVNFGFSLIALLIVVLFTQFPIGPTALMFITVLPALVLFSAGIGLFLAALEVFFRDVGHFYGVFLTLWMYMSAIFYKPEMLGADRAFILKYNPLYRFIKYFRDVVMEYTIPSLNDHLILYGLGVLSIVIGVAVFNLLKNKFVQYL